MAGMMLIYLQHAIILNIVTTPDLTGPLHWNLTTTITSPNLGVLEPHYDYNLTSLQADWNLTMTITSPHFRRIGTSLRL